MRGDGAHRQVGQVGARRQVQLAEGVPEELGEGKDGEILETERGTVTPPSTLADACEHKHLVQAQ